MYYTYIIRCSDNSLYTGITTDLNRRMWEHFSKDKKCAKYTKNHDVQKLEIAWKTENRALASKLEFHIKKLKKEQKEKLILKNNMSELLPELDFEKYRKIIKKPIFIEQNSE